MLDDLLNLITQATDVRPNFTGSRCLAVRRSPDACSACQDVCPHEAVTVTSNRVTVDDVNCSGCGLCVQACPTDALEARVTLQADGQVKCREVTGDAQTVECLARLRPTDITGLARGQSAATLAHGDCADCPIGNATVPDTVRNVAARAEALAAPLGATLRVDVVQTSELNAAPKTMDRRAFLRSTGGQWRQRLGDALAPLDRPQSDDLPAEPGLQRELVLAAANDASDAVAWRLPAVDDRCIMCDACTRACPTDALSRKFYNDGSASLHLNAERCIGCDACVPACPTDAVTMNSQPTVSDMQQTDTTLFTRDASAASAVARDA
jgi:Fe-S-cluster-containing hydrogenase component 2